MSSIPLCDPAAAHMLSMISPVNVLAFGAAADRLARTRIVTKLIPSFLISAVLLLRILGLVGPTFVYVTDRAELLHPLECGSTFGRDFGGSVSSLFQAQKPARHLSSYGQPLRGRAVVARISRNTYTWQDAAGFLAF